MSDEKSSPTAGGQDSQLYLLTLFGVLAVGSIYLRPTFYKAMEFAHHPTMELATSLVGFALCATVAGACVIWNRYVARHLEDEVLSEDEESCYLGREIDTKKKVHLKANFRTMHTELVGTTNAGKTASIMAPWTYSDIELGRGLIFIDGKSDQNFLNQLYARVVQAGREKDFYVFSLARPAISSTFNPFCQGSPELITERVFSAFQFENEFYKSIQFDAFRTIVTMIMHRGKVPMPGLIRELVRDRAKLQNWTEGLSDSNLVGDVLKLIENKELEKDCAGLIAALGHFSQGATSALFNTTHPEITLSDALKNGKICYFQLPTMQFGFLGAATGRLLLQSLQSAISELQVSGGGQLKNLFSIYLDDFNDYMYTDFVSLLNKSRSAKIGVVFAHQSIGDLEKVSPEFRKISMTNTNLKVIMRSNDPDSAEYFAKMIGTQTTEKTTERRRKGLFKPENTGDQSVRETEEYLIHPNYFKSGLGRGEGVVVIPYEKGQIVRKVKFKAWPDIPVLRMPVRDLLTPDFCTAALNGKEQPVQPNAPARREKQTEKEETKNNPYS